jgi:purine-nucleoside phosphorylase
MATPHISAPDNAFAKTVLLAGDPLRAKYIADNYLTAPQLVTSVRNMLGYTGLYNGKPISVMGSGMGMASIGIYSYELYQFYGVDSIIRIGSAGSYTPQLKLMDVALATCSYSDSTYALMQNGYQDHVNYPSPQLNKLIEDTAKTLGIELKPARVHSSDVFYADADHETWQQLSQRTATDCVEMESFALFHNANALHRQAAALLTISDTFWAKEELSAEQRQTSLTTMIRLALEAATRQP